MRTERLFIKGMPIDNYSVRDIADSIVSGKKIFHVFVNIHKMVEFHKNKNLQPIIYDARAVFSLDGKWPQVFAYLQDRVWRHKFGGMDMIHGVFARADLSGQSFPIYLYGAKKDVIDTACDNLKRLYPHAFICGVKDGFSFTDEDVLEDIRQKKPAAVFIALPSPRREALGYRIFNGCDCVKYAAGVGGAFDILAKKYKRAPVFIQNIGLEWFYRCFQSPSLIKRYMYDFFYLVRLLLYEDVKQREN